MEKGGGGRPLRILVASPGLDAHDLPPMLFAMSMRDAGFEVIFLGIRQEVERIVAVALQEDVDIVALSIWGGIHLEVARDVVELLRQQSKEPIPVIVGGAVPPQDVPKLREVGALEAFIPGTPTVEIAKFLHEKVKVNR